MQAWRPFDIKVGVEGAANMRILLVEDEFMIADKLVGEIQDFGDDVVGPFGDVDDAIHYVEFADAAILDIKVGDETTFAVADALRNRDTPFLFLTGYGRSLLPPRFATNPLFFKPSHAHPLLDDLHAQSKAICPVESAEDLIVELLARARMSMPDKDAAERLAEAAVRKAINEIDKGRSLTSVGELLRRKLEEEIRLRAATYLQ
ncbi:response regulator [Paracoccus albicereus]|uniref:response regulator n=1 Tax=Paracoccus albicereus TaxID=2922394 RepID=UPI00210084C2|nr:response regulator [Paracoccus albicereus]